MDGKLILGFLADLLYLKGIITDLESDAMYDARNIDDLDNILDNITREVYKNEGRYIGNKI